MEYNIPTITKRKPLNPFIGKSFRVVVYRGEIELSSEKVEIEDQTKLKTVLENIKQFNNAQEELLKSGYSQKAILVKKLITE